MSAHSVQQKSVDLIGRSFKRQSVWEKEGGDQWTINKWRTSSAVWVQALQEKLAVCSPRSNQPSLQPWAFKYSTQGKKRKKKLVVV